MENWLTSHPGQINGVIGQNDEMALGAIEAIKAAKPEGRRLRHCRRRRRDRCDQRRQGTARWHRSCRTRSAQAQGALDVAIKAAKKGDYKPESDYLDTVSRHEVERRQGEGLPGSVDPGYAGKCRQAAGIAQVETRGERGGSRRPASRIRPRVEAQ